VTRARRGIGIPVLVAVLLAVVATVQVTQHLFTGQVVVQASRSLGGRVCWQLAIAAVQEARGLVAARAAKPDTAEFKLFRSAPGGSVQSIVLSASDLTETVRLIAQNHGGNFELVSISATHEPKRALIAGDIDQEGVLAIEAVVRSKIESVERIVQRRWAYKTVHVAPGPGLKDAVAMIRAADRVLKGRYDAHQIARTGVEQDFPALITEVKKTVDDAQAKRASASGQEQQLLDQLRDLYQPLIAESGESSILALKNKFEPRFRALAPLPGDPKATILVLRGNELSPAELDLQGDLDPLVTKHRQARDDSIRLAERARAEQSSAEAALAAYRAHRDSLVTFSKVIGQEVERYVRFRETFALVPSGESAALLTDYQRIDPVARFPNLPGVPLFDLTMCALLDARKLQPSPGEALTRTLARLSGPKGFFGTILVENGDQPLTITGPLKGRFVLAVNGPLTIENVSRSGPEDLITVVHAAEETRPLTLSGTIDATVVGVGTKLTIRRGTTVTGGLFLQDVDTTAVIEPELTDPDRIKPDPLRAGDAERLRHVIFSPWTRSLGSGRSR
jgi:hypothetical protein